MFSFLEFNLHSIYAARADTIKIYDVTDFVAMPFPMLFLPVLCQWSKRRYDMSGIESSRKHQLVWELQCSVATSFLFVSFWASQEDNSLPHSLHYFSPYCLRPILKDSKQPTQNERQGWNTVKNWLNLGFNVPEPWHDYKAYCIEGFWINFNQLGFLKCAPRFKCRSVSAFCSHWDSATGNWNTRPCAQQCSHHGGR